MSPRLTFKPRTTEEEYKYNSLQAYYRLHNSSRRNTLCNGAGACCPFYFTSNLGLRNLNRFVYGSINKQSHNMELGVWQWYTLQCAESCGDFCGPRYLFREARGAKCIG